GRKGPDHRMRTAGWKCFIVGVLVAALAGTRSSVSADDVGAASQKGMREEVPPEVRGEEREEEKAVVPARVPCARVVMRVTQEETVQKGRAANLSILARQLGTSRLWVERCMLAYGRQPAHIELENAEEREDALEKLEEEEPEERSVEDVEEPGAR